MTQLDVFDLQAEPNIEEALIAARDELARRDDLLNKYQELATCLRDELEKLDPFVLKLTMELEEALAALKPFAKLGGHPNVQGQKPADSVCFVGQAPEFITFGDLRTAHAVAQKHT